jgi:hypothetical protein
VPDTNEDVTTAETGSVWRAYVHRLGGDLIAIETADPQTAALALNRALGLDDDQDAQDTLCSCCGPEWDEYEGPLPDGGWPTRPPEDLLGMGPRWDGSPRAQYVTADQVAASD